MEIFKNVINTRNWRWQSLWDTWIKISSLINKIESWYFKSEKVKIKLEDINLWSYDLWIDDMYDFILHTKLMENCDLSHPVIIDHKWWIIDWRHRLAKAILKWNKYIKWVRLLENIYP